MAIHRSRWPSAARFLRQPAGAIASEERRRQGRADPNEAFLSSHVEPFRTRVEAAYQALLQLTAGEPSPHDVATFEDQVAHDIAPINTTGLCDPAKRNLYPYA